MSATRFWNNIHQLIRNAYILGKLESQIKSLGASGEQDIKHVNMSYCPQIYVSTAYLQPFCLSGLNIQSTRFATNCPNATIAIFVDTILPRTWDGAHSAKYIGIVVDVKPEIDMIIKIKMVQQN